MELIGISAGVAQITDRPSLTEKATAERRDLVEATTQCWDFAKIEGIALQSPPALPTRFEHHYSAIPPETPILRVFLGIDVCTGPVLTRLKSPWRYEHTYPWKIAR